MEKRLSKLESEANNVKAIPTEIKTVIEIEKDVEKLKIQNNEVQMKLKSHEKKLEIQKDAEATNEAFFQKTEVSLKFIEDNQSTLNKTILNYKRLCPSVCVSVTSFHNFSAVTDLNF